MRPVSGDQVDKSSLQIHLFTARHQKFRIFPADGVSASRHSWKLNPFLFLCSTERAFMLQELLHFMPIKKTTADRKDNLTVYSNCSLRAKNLNLQRDFRAVHLAEYSWLQAYKCFLKLLFVKGFMSANKPQTVETKK